MAQPVARVLGKDEVPGSNPGKGFESRDLEHGERNVFAPLVSDGVTRRFRREQLSAQSAAYDLFFGDRLAGPPRVKHNRVILVVDGSDRYRCVSEGSERFTPVVSVEYDACRLIDDDRYDSVTADLCDHFFEAFLIDAFVGTQFSEHHGSVHVSWRSSTSF